MLQKNYIKMSYFSVQKKIKIKNKNKINEINILRGKKSKKNPSDIVLSQLCRNLITLFTIFLHTSLF